ncbi:MAG: VOC family protein [Candidatus Magnetobacterium sp. LHC-1]|uniref:VOC family protein n=1 Tax=Candidatus Magnetobacterium casense TaxID=1455061 RepID=A0ABS6RXU1_9BACT|nr:VOC family protein [Candidatus Magnetobacterium casensis]MBF0606197.1 VOC family protein [Nitrospirota bacterium]MBV6340854.1 VOC family protein [Candidatus Magnetobacterium casensis]
MGQISFAHVGLTCNNQAVMEEFYTKHLGFKRTRVIALGDKQIIMLRNNEGVYLEVFEAEEPRPVPQAVADGPHYAGLRHLSFNVDSVDNKLKEMGSAAEITLGPLNFDDFIKGWRTVWLKDPEGNIVELSEGYKD